MNDHLGGDLAGGIDVSGVRKMKWLVLGQRSVAACARVNPDGAGEEDPANVIEPGRFQNVCRSCDIQINCVHRVLVRVVHIRDRCQVKNVFATLRGLNQCG